MAGTAAKAKIPDLTITQSGPGYKFTLDGKHELFLTGVNCPLEKVTEIVGMLRNAWRAYVNNN